VKTELRRRMHDPIPEVGAWLKSVVGGHIRYFGVPGNRYALAYFRFQVSNLWHRVLRRRSQKGRVPWERMNRLIQRWLPPAAFALFNGSVHLIVGQGFEGFVTSFASGYAIAVVPAVTGNAWGGSLVQTLTNAVGRLTK